ncbi:MAG TPA: amidohydrolase family protein [Terracidiphilus sp.]|nr:amidohydrolase family protein [Terracidiphilus sp.]
MNRRRFLAQSAAGAFALRSAWASPSQSTAGAPLMIDSHVHVFKHDPQFPFAPGAKPPAEDAPVEKLIELMRANNVARTVIIQVIHYRWDNSYLASVLKRYPHLFHGVCRVNPEDPAAPDHLSELTAQGFRGVRLSPAATAEGDWIRGPLMPPLWRRCSQLKVPMTILVTPTRLPDLVPLIEANPELTVVIDHMADCPLDRPDLLKLLLDLARFPKVFVKISDMWVLSKQPYPYPDAQEQVKRLVGGFGANRLMWDTNWPVSLAQLPYAKIVELYRDHFGFVTPEEHKEILSGTVQRVWPFGL